MCIRDRFLSTAKDSLKIASTTFVIPFAFVYSPELMTFPNLGLNVIPAIIEVLAIQIAASIACYGYCFRHLVGWERWVFTAITLSAFFYMTLAKNVYLLAALALTAAMMFWLISSRQKNVKQVDQSN